ncbi:peptidase M50B-like protein [Pseudonocardia hierapolitana]|uniref:Peptidase M50B-like protein n=1 Tax=Pseudonocardia hierapolitana TaxID=1128676 RepID=A0A561T0P8_9PSEU|nr:M50 family metallopeptidase [Pseudonocardia hierapolitana]TWF80692.1 peptidase M50B-like protein [Pseudonocardia hierapolitana]
MIGVVQITDPTLDAVNAIPVVGEPLAWGLGFAMLLLVVFTDSWARSLVTVAHEGGHMAMAVLTFRGHRGFTLKDGGGGATELIRYHWSVSDLLTTFAGYPTPCLLGLGGAAAIGHGNAWAVVWASLFLLIWSFFQAANALANVVTLLAVIGVGWAALAGTAYVHAAVAVGMVWWMLIGGVYYSTIALSRGDRSDAHLLASRTLIPRIVWHAAWAAIGIACLVAGARHMLVR